MGNEICFSSWSSGLMPKKTAAGCDLLSWEAGLGGLCKQDSKINRERNLDSFQCCVEPWPLLFSLRRKIAEICTMTWEVAFRYCPSYSFPAWLFALPDAAGIFCFSYPTLISTTCSNVCWRVSLMQGWKKSSIIYTLSPSQFLSLLLDCSVISKSGFGQGDGLPTEHGDEHSQP